ncbi:aldo/keto reductase [bacterium]|nr:aldo/keto reductase [bacterium]
MKTRTFGNTGLGVTPIGLGTAQIGYLGLGQHECDRLLAGALDLGINLIDTAASYMDSEEKIGRAISNRRGEFILVTKCGQHIDPDDPPEWTGSLVRKSLERSLRRLATDHVDVILLHSCPLAKLKEGELVEALLQCRADGLTKAIGYSGDNEAALEAAGMKGLDCVEMSLNICDQGPIDRTLPTAAENGKAVIAKRSLANAPWRDAAEHPSFYETYVQPYVKRLRAMGFTPDSLGFGGDWAEMAVRFAAYQQGVSCALVGGTKLEHIRENIDAIERGPLPAQVQEGIRAAWREHATADWIGQT